MLRTLPAVLLGLGIRRRTSARAWRHASHDGSDEIAKAGDIERDRPRLRSRCRAAAEGRPGVTERDGRRLRSRTIVIGLVASTHMVRGPKRPASRTLAIGMTKPSKSARAASQMGWQVQATWIAMAIAPG